MDFSKTWRLKGSSELKDSFVLLAPEGRHQYGYAASLLPASPWVLALDLEVGNQSQDQTSAGQFFVHFLSGDPADDFQVYAQPSAWCVQIIENEGGFLLSNPVYESSRQVPSHKVIVHSPGSTVKAQAAFERTHLKFVFDNGRVAARIANKELSLAMAAPTQVVVSSYTDKGKTNWHHLHEMSIYTKPSLLEQTNHQVSALALGALPHFE
jgi:hypothetical protein